MAQKFFYFDVDVALQKHDFVIRESGGVSGVKNRGAIESVLEHVQNDDYYPELMDKLVYLTHSINKNHSFHDGNKRASIALSALFLELNGYDYAVRGYQNGMEDPAVWLACSVIDKDTLRDIMTFLLEASDEHILAFIAEAKRYRPFIESGTIPSHLLKRMITAWLSDTGELSEDIQLDLFDILTNL